KMESIIYNLLSNAFKYTPREGKISVDLSADDGEVLIEVRNSGVGIAEEEIPHIFEKFYRAEYFRDKSEGAGIGLSIVSEFVELHGGSIEVESILNDHTTFRVTIPMVEAQSELKSGELKEERLRVIEEFEDAVNQRDNKQKILYVDDNTQILEMVSIILSGDYTVITATDGQDGFEKCKRYRPDIVITDIMMPGSDGIELCKKIKSTPQVNSTPIIAMTAKSQVDDQIVGVNAGIDAYLTKPINVELIHATIEQMLRRGEEQKRQMKQLNVFDESELKSQDKILMDSIMEVIHARLSDPQLTVEMIAEELNISNASLYRKVKQLTGFSTNELIKKIRLKKADVLMQRNYGSLSEIAYKVGFSSPSYFSKCYKMEFGCAPRDTK
ncbi:MAG: ATP-binding protein, partial [Rikenellaceae bacterium]